MGDNIKKIGIRNDSGEYTYTDIGVDADKVDIDNTTLDQKISTIETNITNHTTALGNKVDKVSGKGLSTNDYTTTEKTKLSGIAEGAEVNQNAFANVVVGSTTIAADAKSDSLTLVAGSNVTITPDATNDKITISSTDTTYDLATTSADGLMSKEDKAKLDNMSSGGGSGVSGIKGSAEEDFRTGMVEITAEDIGLGNVLTDLDLKLDKKIDLNNTSINDVYQTGIYKSTSWLDSPFSSTDNQGILIVFNYAGNVATGWFTQIFIDPHYSRMKIRHHSNINYSAWEDFVNSENINKYALISKKGSDTGLIDLNDYKTTGIYHINNSNEPNNPTQTQGTLFVEFDVGTPYQLWFPDSSYAVYKRLYISNAWQPWVTLFSQKSIEFQIVNGELQYRYDTGVWG